MRVGGRQVPVILPNRRDARLHTAAVIISVHVIGITALGFRVSVPQILAGILTAGLIDVALSYRTTGMIAWPASGMLTGSGVALILRLVGMESGDYWAFTGWHWFSLVAGVSILTKYVIKFRGNHVFNPSNIGLVAAFVVLGSGFVEPLDFWWAPLGPAMIIAYLIIIGGGILITRRLKLLEMAVTFWVVFAVGLGVLAISGHCMTAAWSTTPVCGDRFWSVLVTSPEVLIFLFFMITDPKTIPSGRAARFAFAGTLGLATVLMIAPHTVEYGAKVGLLGSLAIWSPLRALFDRALPETGRGTSGAGVVMAHLMRSAPIPVFVRGLVGGAAVVLAAVAIVAAGVPARVPAEAAALPDVVVDVEVETSSLPEVTVDESVHGVDVEVDDEFVDILTVTLAENLALEAEAVRTANGSLLAAADGGARLDTMQARLDEAIATGERWADEYRFDSLDLSLHEAEEGQSSAGFVFDAEGRVDRVLFDTEGTERERVTESFSGSFVLRQLAGDRWLIVSDGPIG